MGAVAGYLAGCGTSSIPEVGGTSLALGSPADSTRLATTNDGDESAIPGVDRKAAAKVAAKLTEASIPGTTGYKIGPQDVLEISVFKVPELSKVVQVTEAGTFNYPLIGETEAAGHTAREIEKNLTSKLGAKYLQKPQVSVMVKEYNSQRVTIEGAVKKPGVYPIQGRMTLIQALAIAQGLDPNSDNNVIVFREASGKRSAARFDVSSLRSGEATDPELKAGDVIVANSSATKEMFNNFLRALPVASVFALL
jgi:polysaccharide export outer membrane protein